MASRNMKLNSVHGFDSANSNEKMQSSTLKRQPSPDWSKSDLLRLLSYFEGELQARDVAIATLKAEKAKQLLYQAKYGRFGLGDPFIALQRDAEGKNDTGFDEAAIKSMYDNQLAQLENLIATQRKAQLKMREQLGNSEKRFHKLCTELEEEKQKHAQDTAQGDDVTYMLEKERERLKAEIDFEKSQNKKLEKDLKKALASLEEEKANAARHKQVAIMLIKERKNLIERIVAENHLRDEMENALTDGKSKIQSMAEGLAQESKKSLKMEVALDKQSCKFDTEREALRLRLQEEEKQTNMLRAEVACLSKQLESLQLQVRNSTSSPIASQLRSSVSPARTTNSSSARSTALTGGVLSASAGLASQSPLVVVSTPSQHPSCAATSVAATSSSSIHLEFLGLEMANLQNVLATMMSGKTSACNTHVNRPGTLSLLASNSSSHSSKPMATEISLARNKQNLNGDSFSVENTNSLSFTTDTQIKIRTTQNFSSANSYTEQNIPLSEVTCNTTDYNIPHHVQNDYLEPVQQNVSLSSSTSYRTGGYQSQPQPVINVPPSSTYRNIPRSRSPTKSRTSSFQKLSVPCKPSHSTFSSLSHSVEDPPVHQLSIKGDASALEQLLCLCPSSVNMVVKDNSTALHRAAEQDQDICLKLLLEKGAKPDCFRDDQMTPLHIAALKGYAKCVEVLLTNGAQVNLLAQKKQTALHLAIKGGHAECCDMLIRYNADILLTDQAGLTSVHYAVQNNHSHILKPLLNKLGLSQSKDSDIGYQLMSITDNDGWTVAHMAAYLPKPDCLIILAESMGLDLEIKDHLGRSVSAVASPACKEILSELDHFVRPLLKVNVELRYILEQKVVSNVQIGTLDVCTSMGWRYLEDRLRNTLNVYLTHLDAGLKTRRISRLDGDSDKEFSLGVGLTNITQYELGLYRWNPGEPSDTVPYTMMYNNQLRKITIIVDGLDNRSELIAFDVLQPVATINNYLRLLEQNKTVILYGPSGSGKSYLAQRLAQSIAAQEISLGRKPRIYQLSLETGYPWLSFFTFLREKNCVLPMDRVNDNEAQIVVLDNLDQVDMAHMFGELLDAMEYRGAKHTFVLRDGQGESRIHYLSDHFYLIGTMNKSRSLGVDLSILPRFRWVQFRLDTEPLRGLLARHFWRRIFNIYRGQLPSPDDQVLRAIEWIICVWHRLNDSFNKLGLMEVVIGPCMFFKCPLEKQDHQIILEWMKSFWNKKVAPSVRETVKRGTGSETPPDGHNKVANTALYVLMQRSIMIGCPLAGQEKENYLAGFYGSNELDIPLKTNDRALSLSSQKRLKSCSGSVSTRRWRSEIDETQTRIRGRPSKEEKETVNTNQTSNIKRRSLSESSVNKALQIEEQQGLVSPSSLHAKVAKLEVKSPKLVNIKAVFFSPSSRTPQKSDSTLSATSVHKSGRVSPLLSLVAGRHSSPQKSRSTENISSSGTYNYAKVKSPGPFSFSLSTPKSNLNIFKLLDKAYNEESLSKKLSEEMPDFSVFDQVTTPTEEPSKAFYFGQKDEKNSDFSTEKSPTLKRKVDSFTASSKEENYES